MIELRRKLLIEISTPIWKSTRISPESCVEIARAIKEDRDYKGFVDRMFKGRETQAIARLQVLSGLDDSSFLKEIGVDKIWAY